MTLVPAVLVLIVGSELIRTSVERWFNAPMDEILSSANQIASDYYHERQLLVSDHATPHREARWRAVDLSKPDVRPDPRPAGARRHAPQRVQMVEVYRVGAAERVAARPGAGRRRRGAVAAGRTTAAPRRIGWPRRR